MSLLFGARARTLRRRAHELRRRVLGRPHTVILFLELDDPYSYLLSLHVPELRSRFDIEVRLQLTETPADEFRPRAEMQAVHAVQDCKRLAEELGIPFLDKGAVPPVEHRRALIDTLAALAGSAEFDAVLLEVMQFYWRGDIDGVSRRIGKASTSTTGAQLLQEGQRLLRKLGHYSAATLYYGGEWYWGVDRIQYLTERLRSLGALRADAPPPELVSPSQFARLSLPIAPPSSARQLPALEYFVSFRSPYSYLSMQRVFAIADAFGLALNIRPVLPMAMRGLQVPPAKLRYIANDTFREAEALDVPFGRFSDPLGSGVERCLATFFYARDEGKEREFLLQAASGIWAEAIDVATDKGLRKITARTGLFWPDVVAAISSSGWREVVEENRASMMASDSWGVPTLRLGEFTVWGQDRLWLLVRHIEETCDTGEGILI